MTTDEALFEKRDGIAVITLNRPKALNAIDPPMNDLLAEYWNRVEEDDEIKVVIVAATGKTFCAGSDLRACLPGWASMNALGIREFTRVGLGGGITRGGHRMYKPIIAAVNGLAVGGGFEVALACDIRIASTNAAFGVFEVTLGIHQGDGGLVRLSAICGLGTALELSLTGRKVDAEEALRLGLVSRVVEEDDLMSKALEYAHMIEANPQQVMRSVKETLYDIQGLSLDQALKLEGMYGYSSADDYGELKKRAAKVLG